jgi:hypothetical protein
MRRESTTSERHRPDRDDVGLAVWIGLLGAGFVDRRALYIALLYAVPYLLLPAVRQMRNGGPLTGVRSTRETGIAMLAMSAGAATVGFIAGFDDAWWLVSGLAAITGGALLLIARRR